MSGEVGVLTRHSHLRRRSFLGGTLMCIVAILEALLALNILEAFLDFWTIQAVLQSFRIRRRVETSFFFVACFSTSETNRWLFLECFALSIF